MMRAARIPLLACLLSAAACSGGAGERLVEVELAYHAPGEGPSPNFSPKGTQVALEPVAADRTLPEGATRPARSGTIKIGPDERAWIPVLAASSAEHPDDLCRLFLDQNRNGRFDDDGPAIEAVPSQNAKTKAWWTSFSRLTLSVPYATGETEPYLVNVWIVREGDTTPGVLRYSVGSWRAGTVTVNGVDALVAAMDSNNDAVWDTSDYWSVLGAASPDAAKAVLSIAEAKPTARMMFIDAEPREIVLEFREFSPDGRSLRFAVLDRPMLPTKAEDRAPDDYLAAERSRPRTDTPFTWSHDFEAALAEARRSNRRVLIDFETTWCGPCKVMDQWIWTDAEVAAALNREFVGVKIDGDIEKDLVKRFNVAGYPTMIVLDTTGQETARASSFQPSKEVLTLIGG